MKLFKTMDMGLLEQHDACREGKEYFRNNFYDGVPTIEVLVKSPQYAEWLCGMLGLCDGGDKERHQKLTEYLYQKAKAYLPKEVFETTQMYKDYYSNKDDSWFYLEDIHASEHLTETQVEWLVRAVWEKMEALDNEN